MLVMGNSATAIFALAMALAVGMVLGALKRFAPNVRMPIALMLGSVALLLGGFLWWNAEVILQLSGRDMTFTGRSDIWAAGFTAISSTLCEVMATLSGYRQPRATAHLGLCWRHCGALTQFLADAWLQTAIFGMLAVIFITASTFLKAFWSCLRSNDESSMVLSAIITFLLVRSFFEVEFTDPAPTGLFWLIWSPLLSGTAKLRARCLRRMSWQILLLEIDWQRCTQSSVLNPRPQSSVLSPQSCGADAVFQCSPLPKHL